MVDLVDSSGIQPYWDSVPTTIFNLNKCKSTILPEFEWGIFCSGCNGAGPRPYSILGNSDSFLHDWGEREIFRVAVTKNGKISM